MTKAMFVLGVFDPCAKDGVAPLSDQTLKLLKDLAKTNDLHVEVAVAVPMQSAAGLEKVASLKWIRHYRPALVRKIKAFEPDFVFCFGKVAASSVLDKGSVVLSDVTRTPLHMPDIPGKIVVIDSMSRVAAQPGVAEWLYLDIAAALHGFTDTVWGDYTILRREDPKWGIIPSELLDSIQDDRLVGFDLETYPGLSEWHPEARIRMGMLSSVAGRAWVVQCTETSEFPDWFVHILRTKTIIKAGSNIAFDYRWCRRFGVDVVNMFDTSVAQHIINETDPKKGLKDLVLRYLPRLADYASGIYTVMKKRGGGKNDWHLLLDEDMYLYAGGDAEGSVAAARAQTAIIKEQGLERAHQLARGLYQVLCRMQADGACFDMEKNLELDAVFDRHLTDLRKRIQTVLGPINVASPIALAPALKKAVPSIDLTTGKIKRFLTEDDTEDEEDEISTAKRILSREAAKHPVIGDVLEFRKWHKLYGTYVLGLREKHAVNKGGRWFVFPSYNQNRVDTNRLSSSNPNQQNIPRKPGKSDPPELNVKLQFVSRFEGGHILEADYSQAELRVAAMMSGDEAMIEALTSGRDVHKETAAMLLHKDYDNITPEERQTCKTLNFLILYGGGANTLSQQLGITKDEAKAMLDQYFRTFKTLHKYIKSVHADVKRDLFVESPFGFRRRFFLPPEKPRPKWDVNPDNDWKYDRWNQWEGWAIQRRAFNMMVQNTAACYPFCAMIEIEEEMKLRGLRSIMFGTVHDSILFDVYPGEEEELAGFVKHIMENVDTQKYGVNLTTVPMLVELEMGKSWGDKAPYPPKEEE